MRLLTILLFFFSLNASAQTFTFECVSGARLSGDSCDICPNTIVNSRSFNGLVIYLDSAFYKWVDQPYSVRTKPGNIVEYWEHGANPYSERVTIPLELTDFFTVEGMADSTWCNFTAPNRYQELLLDSLSPTLAKAKIQVGNTGFGIKAGSGITFDFDSDTLILNSSGGGGTANNGVSDNEDGGKFRVGNRYMGTPDAPFTMDRSLNIDGRVFFIGDLSDSTLLTIEGATDKVGFGVATPQRKVDVNGEVRIRDLTTDTPTGIVGHDADGDLGTISTGTGISLSGGVLSSSIVQGYWKIRDGGTLLTSRESMQFNDAATIAFTLADDVVDGETDIEASIVANSVGNTHIREGVARSVIGVTGNAAANVADIQGTADQVLRVNTAGTALAFGQVATGGITDLAVTTAKIADANVTTAKLANLAVTTAKIADANVTTAKLADQSVTYAKMQNAVANNVLLGNNNGAGTAYEELNAAAAQTILGFIDGAGANQRIPYFTDANTLAAEAAFLYDAGNDRQTIVCATPGLGAGAAILNLTNTGPDGTGEFLQIRGDISVNLLSGMTNTNTGGTANTIWNVTQSGNSAGDAVIQLSIAGAGGNTTAVGIDNSDVNKFKITPNGATPGVNGNASLVGTNDAIPLWGINKDAPGHPLDVGGRNRAVQFISTYVEPTVGSLGNGLGTGPTIDDITGADNGFIVTFSTGTAPTAGGTMFTVTYSTSYPTFAVPVFCQSDDDAANEFSKFTISAVNGGGFTMKVRTGQTLTASTQYVLHFVVGGQG